MYDQTEEIEFEERFKQELFRKKETALRMRKHLERPESYLSESMDHNAIEYLEAKKDIKNMRVNHMLGTRGNNKLLNKMIESGLLDNPDKLRKEIEAYGRRHNLDNQDTGENKMLVSHSKELQVAEQEEDISVGTHLQLLE